MRGRCVTVVLNGDHKRHAIASISGQRTVHAHVEMGLDKVDSRSARIICLPIVARLKVVAPVFATCGIRDITDDRCVGKDDGLSHPITVGGICDLAHFVRHNPRVFVDGGRTWKMAVWIFNDEAPRDDHRRNGLQAHFCGQKVSPADASVCSLRDRDLHSVHHFVLNRRGC